MRRTILAIAILGSGVVIISGILFVNMIGLRAQPALRRAPYASFRAQYGRRSPHESTSADVDGATLTIVYGRPSMRGRVIFGGLVPYDVVWCPGADEATTLESTLPIQIDKLRVPPGPHTLWLLPTAGRTTLIVSKESSGFHTRYPSGDDLGRVALTTRHLESDVEQLTFTIAPRAPNGGTIAMAWERTELSVPFRVVQ